MGNPIVAIIAMGEMGSAIAQRLTSRGATVRTSLAGRSAASAKRAVAAGASIHDDDRAMLDGADFILSIVPPSEAGGIAQRFLPVLSALPRKPMFVDCNAIAPETARGIAASLLASGAEFVDGGILGAPPKQDDAGPRIYVSGPAAEKLIELAAYGLDIRVVSPEIGAASAIKLCYAALGKGLVAIGVGMILSAQRAGIQKALFDELASTSPHLLTHLVHRVPEVYTNAHRWTGEMEEIAKHLSGLDGAQDMYVGAARLFDGLAAPADGDNAYGGAVSELKDFLGR